MKVMGRGRQLGTFEPWLESSLSIQVGMIVCAIELYLKERQSWKNWTEKDILLPIAQASVFELLLQPLNAMNPF